MSVSRPVDVLHRMVASLSIPALLSSDLRRRRGTLPDRPQQSTQTGAAVNAQGQAEYPAPLGQYTQPYSMPWARGSRMCRTCFRNRS